MICQPAIFGFSGVVLGAFMLFTILMFWVIKDAKWILIMLFLISIFLVFSSPMLLAMMNTWLCEI